MNGSSPSNSVGFDFSFPGLYLYGWWCSPEVCFALLAVLYLAVAAQSKYWDSFLLPLFAPCF